MIPVAIDDLDDPRIDIYRSLKATNQTRRLDRFVVEGERLVERLMASRFPLVSILVVDRLLSKIAARIPTGVTTYIIPDALMNSLVGFPFHRGILACGQRQPRPPLSEVFGTATRPLTVVICPKLSDPQNLGALARIADVFGVDAILTGPECPDPFSRRVLRVSMGSALRVPIAVEHPLVATVTRLCQECGLELWGAVADPSAEPFESIARPERLGLVLGEEDQGLPPDWLNLCKRHITIPMRPGASSLNVSVAAGILLYRLTRRPQENEG